MWPQNMMVLTHRIVDVPWLSCFLAEWCYLFVSVGRYNHCKERNFLIKMVWKPYNTCIRVPSKSFLYLYNSCQINENMCFCFMWSTIEEFQIKPASRLWWNFLKVLAALFLVPSSCGPDFPFLNHQSPRKELCVSVCVCVYSQTTPPGQKRKKQRSKTLKNNEQKMLIMFLRQRCFW